jgi:maleate cis-trans isomerase
VIDDLETRLERPIVTSNQAVIWDALRSLAGACLRATSDGCLR